MKQFHKRPVPTHSIGSNSGFLASGVERFDQENMWTDVGQIEEVSLLDKAEITLRLAACRTKVLAKTWEEMGIILSEEGKERFQKQVIIKSSRFMKVLFRSVLFSTLRISHEPYQAR